MADYVFIPPVSKPAGGVAALVRVADVLHKNGNETFIVALDERGWLPERTEGAAPFVTLGRAAPGPDDVWLVPEGWVNALAPGITSQARCVSYCQNQAFLFSSLPEGVAWKDLPVEHLAVSHPVAWFIELALGKRPPILRPGIDRKLLCAPDKKPGGKIRIAWMPRKNKAVAAQIRAVFEARNQDAQVRWTEISGLGHSEVARILQASHIFLCTGFPEGLGLPPLEAMACGCLPVGFGGFGGFDYMRQALENPNFEPWWPLRDVPWSGNGLWSADGDIMDAALNLEIAVSMLASPDKTLDDVLLAGQETADAYSYDEQERAIHEVWKGFR